MAQYGVISSPGLARSKVIVSVQVDLGRTPVLIIRRYAETTLITIPD